MSPNRLTARVGGDGPTTAACGVLLVAAALHLWWAAGGRRPSIGVVPTVDGEPAFVPSTRATRGVAGALAAAALAYAGSARRWPPVRLHRIGSLTAGTVLVARAVGNGRTVGLTKSVRGTAFARNDDRLFTPLCAVLGAIGIRAAVRAGRAGPAR
jgi:hypothetical protein